MLLWNGSELIREVVEAVRASTAAEMISIAVMREQPLRLLRMNFPTANRIQRHSGTPWAKSLVPTESCRDNIVGATGALKLAVCFHQPALGASEAANIRGFSDQYIPDFVHLQTKFDSNLIECF